MPQILSAREAVAGIPDGATIMLAGFLGAPEALVDALVEQGARGLTIIANDTGFENAGIGKLVHARRVRKAIVSHIGTNPETQRLLSSGKLEVELVPQGTLAERVRAGGHGLGGVLTPTGVGTAVEEGKAVHEIGGRRYLLELPLRADVALLHASVADRAGNLFHRMATRNWNPLMAMAADRVVVSTERVVEVGDLDPDVVHTVGVLVDVLVPQEGRL